MDLNLHNKVAIVTGASAGLEKAIALSLAQEGAKVAISARRADVLEQTANDITSQTNQEVFTFAGDMTEASQIEHFVKEVVQKLGTVHILINNVGQATRGDLLSLEQEDWQKTLDINLLSAVQMTRKVIPLMQKQHWGRIINISALSGKEPSEDLIASNVVKTGLVSFSKTLARELAADNILVNCVSPGLIESPQNDRYFSASEREQAESKIPLGRFGQPEEFASIVTFLCSEQASYVTGINLLVDGGASHGL